MQKIKIVALVLTYNEEKRIKNVLDCLQDFDEVIVWDKSSTDHTREIAVSCGARIFQTEYYNDTIPCKVKKEFIEAISDLQDMDWIFGVTASDIVHKDLYGEMIDTIHKIDGKYEVIEVPIYRYSMGVVGKHSYFGDLMYQAELTTKRMMNSKSNLMTKVHENPYQNDIKFQMHCTNPQIAIYHLTHENLTLVMDRHWRYAVQYIEDSVNMGKTRRDIMKYAWHECIRVLINFFKIKAYKLGEVGMAQMMMLIMYNAMIYLNAFFSREREQDISNTYSEIKKMCIDKDVIKNRNVKML